jgi:hypothetical protein
MEISKREVTRVEVTLTLTEYEAGVLVAILGKIGGVGRAKGVVFSLYDALNGVLNGKPYVASIQRTDIVDLDCGDAR